MDSGDASRCRIPDAPRGRARRATALAILIALVCVVQFAGDTAVRRLRAR